MEQKINQKNETVGVFDAIDLYSEDGIEKLIKSVEEKKYFILILDENCKRITENELVRKMYKKACWNSYCSLIVIVNGEGTKNFKKIFHRSSSYVDSRMFPLRDFKMIFKNDQRIIEFFDNIEKMYGDIHVKGMRKILLK